MSTDPSGIIVRVTTSGDGGAIASLRALWKTDGPPPSHFEARVAAWLAEDGDRRTTWLATADGQAIGMASLFEYRRMPSPAEPDSAWGYVAHLFVRPDLRRHGIGSALVDAIVAAAERRGYARLIVSPSRDALVLFGRRGFVTAGGSPGNDCLLVRPINRM
jgi:GNAT superfamily N-acetyltransferase